MKARESSGGAGRLTTSRFESAENSRLPRSLSLLARRFDFQCRAETASVQRIGGSDA
jgi:hypothetical protein